MKSWEGIEENNESDKVGVKESVVRRSMIQTEENRDKLEGTGRK